jgi:hypothetical protein
VCPPPPLPSPPLPSPPRFFIYLFIINVNAFDYGNIEPFIYLFIINVNVLDYGNIEP